MQSLPLLVSVLFILVNGHAREVESEGTKASIYYRIDISEHEAVTCGSTIKLEHTSSGFRLHSHQVTYGSGSGQQSVTGFPAGNDANSLWVIRAPHAAPECVQGY
jgi:dolichyl-phosphate-mannose--protein O-mannosyl transferase